MALYRSEVHIPVRKDSMDFQERQIKELHSMDQVATERRQQWQSEFDRMRNEFFVLKPSGADRRQSAQLSGLESHRTFFDTDADGRQVFRVRFDVSEFQPEEVNVKVQDGKLCVNARHEQKTAQTSVSREYSRQVDIPAGVDQDSLNCLLSKDGVLSVEGPVTQPSLLSRETFLPIKSSISPASPSSPSPSASPLAPSLSSSLNASPMSPARSMGVSTPVKNPIVTDADGTRRMRLSVDIGEFSPDEIVVKATDRKLVVQAAHEERTAGRTLTKQFNKEYELPDSVDASNITAYLAQDATLTIEAPLKPSMQTQQRKVYQVTQSQNVQRQSQDIRRQSQDVQRVMVNKEGSVTISDGSNRPMVTISVHRK